MNSTDLNGRGVEPLSVISLTAGELGIAMRLTAEVRDFDANRVGALGVTESELKSFILLLREVAARLDGDLGVLIHLTGGDAMHIATAGTGRAGADGGASSDAIVVILPARLGFRWYSMLKLVERGLGSKELFYRTGYFSEEMDSVIAKLLL